MAYPDFVEERIADGLIVKNSTGGPVYNTQVQRAFNGSEERNVNWDSALWKGELGECSFLQKQMDVLNAFFRARKGKAIGFRHKDWADYQVAATQGTLALLPAPAAAYTYQLFKNYSTAAGATDLRKIVKPVPGTVKVFQSGAQIACTVNYTTGVVSLPGNPGTAPLSWSGEFDVPVRFDTDELKSRFIAIDRQSGERMHQVFSLPITELKL